MNFSSIVLVYCPAWFCCEAIGNDRQDGGVEDGRSEMPRQDIAPLTEKRSDIEGDNAGEGGAATSAAELGDGTRCYERLHSNEVYTYLYPSSCLMTSFVRNVSNIWEVTN